MKLSVPETGPFSSSPSGSSDALVRHLAAVITAQNEIVQADLDLDTVMRLVALRGQELTGAIGAAVEMAEGDEMVYRATSGTIAAFQGLRLKQKGSLSGYCVASGNLQYAADTETDHRVDREACRKIGARSFLVVPLTNRGQTVGVLKVIASQPHAFGERDSFTLQIMAGLVGATLARAAEASARQAVTEELRRSNAALSEFASIASHDLKEPLRKIRSFGDMLQRKAQSALPEASLGYLERMLDAARRMQTLIDGLLTYSQVTTAPFAPTPVDLGRVTREVLQDLEIRIGDSGGHVELNDALDPQRTPPFCADPLQMRQLMQNLISNALKYHHPDKPPVVQVTLERITNDFVRIVVRDDGIGFAPEHAERIFGMFERLQTRAQYEGTGIGLALCHKIVERHKGTITADSTVGEGAAFTILLPVAPVGTAVIPA